MDTHKAGVAYKMCSGGNFYYLIREKRQQKFYKPTFPLKIGLKCVIKANQRLFWRTKYLQQGLTDWLLCSFTWAIATLMEKAMEESLNVFSPQTFTNDYPNVHFRERSLLVDGFNECFAASKIKLKKTPSQFYEKS